VNLQETVKETRKKQAEQTDEALLVFIRERPGALSLYQIAQEMDWSIGRVQKSVERLSKNGLVSYKRAFLGGRSLKLIVPTRTQENHSQQPAVDLPTPFERTITIPTELVSSDCWSDHAFLYALDRLTLGISADRERRWQESSLLEAKVQLRRVEKTTIVELPENVHHFYLLNVNDYDISTFAKGDKILVTVVGFDQRKNPTVNHRT
jgi:hypothetical protein